MSEEGPLRRLVVLSVRTRRVAFVKDVAEIPRTFDALPGWSGRLAFNPIENDARPSPEDTLDTVRLGDPCVRLPRLRSFLRGARFVILSGRRIDVLLLYHFTLESAALASLFRLVNRRGVAIVKLDMDQPTAMALVASSGLKAAVNRAAHRFAPVTLYTVETEQVLRTIASLFGRLDHDLILWSNGFTPRATPPTDEEVEKAKVVLTVARHGTPQKNSEVLVRAIAGLPDDLVSDWEFRFVGSWTDGFLRNVEEAVRERPRLRSAITVTGHISDRRELLAQYREAAVFVLVSQWESFGLSALEALSEACCVVLTDVGAAKELVSGGAHGELVPCGVSPDELSGVLTDLLSDLPGTVARGRRGQMHVHSRYTWDALCRRLVSTVEARSGTG